MEISGDSGLALARLAEQRAIRATAEARQDERDRTAAQRKAEAESVTFASAQKLIWNGGILQAEGAAAGTAIDIRV